MNFRFIDTCVNRVKHPNLVKKTRVPGPISFRDRGGSNRIPDRPRPRTSLIDSKHMQQSAGESSTSIVDHQQLPNEECDVVVLIILIL